MNFLAHIYLSGENQDVMIGNFIADGIKSKDQHIYPKDIQKGILLHRAIDTYTDSHPTVRKSKKRLFERYSHYSAVIVDILYDHFLAKNWHQYSDIPLNDYVDDFYRALERQYEILPARYQTLAPFMIRDNWLLGYSTIEGITKALEGMNRRTKNRSKMNQAVDELRTYYAEFEEDFTHFFDELIQFASEQLKILSSPDQTK
ncbi:MAG: DUF479 domain-containing protein [Flavobacteriaceae bacterium]|nr:acyl carrier protein phosphodiesterase [Bacteroidia bacterium]NNF74709.1 DUF479 domain-containing protein [Flavobacteriaceae bacterium]NNK73131.1 DUF479 domain-containing protein [Flavobacteriaceae bacterium]